MNVSTIDPMLHREGNHGVAPMFVRRWSPRAMTGEPISDGELKRLFEAARWAPSSYNEQPWRIIYAKRDTPSYQKLFDGLVEFNQLWGKNAAALLVFCCSEKHAHNNEQNTASQFDTGSAWMSLALQASMMDLVAHGMVGFDHEKIAKAVNLPKEHKVLAMAAIGKPGDIENLPEGGIRDKEKPNSRKALNEITFEGAFPG
ncbi:MAG: nitroreductase family protein [Phycisphaerales bacterium]